MFFQNSRSAALAAVIALALPSLASAADKAKLPSQSQLARKGTFPSVSASAPSVKAALPATDLNKARTKLNKSASFVGVVTDIYLPKNGKRALLDFAPDYKKAVIGLVDAKNFKTFPDLRQLKKKRVLLTGKVMTYKDQTQIELASPVSIRLVK